MKTKLFVIFATMSALLLTSLTSISYAQNLGQSAGSLVFNVSLGGNQTLSYIIFDGGSAAITFTVSPPQYNPVGNQTTPTVTVSPLSGTLTPGQQTNVEVTVSMPASDSPGVKWDGIMQVLATTNASNPGGAVIQGGLGKEVIIYSKIPPPTTTVAQSSTPIKIGNTVIYVVIGIVVVVVAVGAGLALRGRGRAPRSKPAGDASTQKRIIELEQELKSLKKSK